MNITQDDTTPASDPMSKTVGVIGLGYVGLPLCIRFAEAGCRVIGFDIDAEKVKSLNEGQSYIGHIASEVVTRLRDSGRFLPTTDFANAGLCDAVLICVPTPLGHHQEPDISYVVNSGRAIAPFLHAGQLVVLESTTYPGTTDTELRQVLEAGSGLRAGTDFHLAFSPEREDPGNVHNRLEKIPKVIGGLTPKCGELAQSIYRIAVESTVLVSHCRVAEACKLLENIFRSVNIALVNELKVVYDAMGIDVWEVVDAARTKPFGFMPFYPGPGLGGHCIPIDPFYLTWKAREYGQHTRFIELAGEINTSMPRYVIGRVQQALNTHGLAVKGSRVLVLGLAYKPNVDDTRESPSYVLMSMLRDLGAQVDYHDPHVPVVPLTREHAEWARLVGVALTEESVSSYDLVLIATAHAVVDHKQIGQWARLIVDTRNAMAPYPEYSAKVVKA
ncbi:MAG: nucleotide sugar dehydrogenase [Roseimicrobium sp.]